MDRIIAENDKDDIEGVSKIIYDEPVLCRAEASLPSKFLYMKHNSNLKAKKGVGVFARKIIPNKALFGPLEGFIVDDDGNRSSKTLHFLVDVDNTFRRLDTSNEFISNWMRYVKPAKSAKEQNLSLHQQGKNLYFTTIRTIPAKEELKVWYSLNYAKTRNIDPDFPINQKKELIKDETSLEYIVDDYQPLLNGQNCLWSCTHCHMKFTSATLLNFHMLTHAADNIETGEQKELEMESINFGVVDLPIESSNDEGNGEITYSLTYTQVESSPIDEGKTFECPICNEVFVKLALLKNHVHRHAEDGVYTCPTCSKTFYSYKHIRNHIRIYHSVRRFECDVCSKRFPTQDKLKHHKLSHTGHKPYLCSECGKQFKRRDKLNDHIKRFHEEGEGVAPKRRQRPDRRKVASPKRCEETISNNSSDYFYKCDACAIGFKRRGMLVNHMANRHPDVPPESVPELSLPIVKTNKDYFCQYCDRVYKSTSKRKSHILKYHPGKQVPLGERQIKSAKPSADGSEPQVDTMFQESGSYTTTPHPCDWCHKQYASRAKLLQHQRQKHLDLMPKYLQEPKKFNYPKDDYYEENGDLSKVDENTLLLQNSLEDNISEYEFHLGENKLFGDGEFIIDAPTLRKALKGDAIAAECSPEALAELGQILDTRPDQYFRIIQTSNGISFARPVEVWDPCQPLSPDGTDGNHLLA